MSSGFQDLTIKERHAPPVFQHMGDVSKTHSKIQPVSKKKPNKQNKYVVIIDSQYYKQYLAEISELFIKHKTLQHILLCYAVSDILSLV